MLKLLKEIWMKEVRKFKNGEIGGKKIAKNYSKSMTNLLKD